MCLIYHFIKQSDLSVCLIYHCISQSEYLAVYLSITVSIYPSLYHSVLPGHDRPVLREGGVLSGVSDDVFPPPGQTGQDAGGDEVGRSPVGDVIGTHAQEGRVGVILGVKASTHLLQRKQASKQFDYRNNL